MFKEFFAAVKNFLSYGILLKNADRDGVTPSCFVRNLFIILSLYVFVLGILFHAPLNIFYTFGAVNLFIVTSAFSLVVAPFVFEFREDFKGRCFFRSLVFLTGMSLILSAFILVFKFFNSPVFRAEDYANFLPVKREKFQKIIVEQPQRIRKVTEEMAVMKANKIMGREINGTQLSTQYELAKPSIIVYKNKEYWIFPLKYSGFFKWIANDSVPGYILVNATEPYKDPVFVKKPYKITANYFNTDIGLIAQFLTGFSPKYIHFEINEKGDPYWIVTKYGYGILFNLYDVSKVYAVNALSGKVSEITNSDGKIKKNFKWVDKIIGEKVNREYIENYGKYSKGFLNYLFVGKNVNVPSTKDLWLIETKIGKLGWFTGMTSTSKKDNSLNYMAVTKADSVKPVLYVIQNVQGVTDENGAVEAINNALGANSIKWEAKLAMPFIINKKFYWVASIVSQNGYYVKEGAVKGNNITQVYIDDSLEKIIKDITALNTKNETGKNIAAAESSTIKKYSKKEILNQIQKIEGELNRLKRMVNGQ